MLKSEGICAASPEEIKSLRGGHGTMLETWKISPIFAYRFMKKYFGKPNKSINSDPDKIQWEYVLKSPHGYLSVYDWKRETWSIGFRYENQPIDEELKIDAELLLSKIKKYCNQFTAFKFTATTYPGKLLLNPFHNHYSNALYHIQVAKKLHFEQEKLGFVYPDYVKRRKLHLQTRNLCQAAFILLMASFEGFLNLLYELYSHEDLDEDQIKYLLRMPLENKLRLLSFFCKAFGRSLSTRTRTFDKFRCLVNFRNAIVHANLTRETKQNIIIEDGHLYYLVKEKYESKYDIPRNPIDIGIEEIYQVKRVIDAMVREVLKTMLNEERESIETVIHEPYIGYIRKHGNVEFRQSQLY